MFELQIDGQVFFFEDENPSLPHWQELRDSLGHVAGFENDKLGMAAVYCKSPVGEYNQVVLYNRGGSVIAPTVYVDHKLYFVVLVQNRPLVQEEPIFEFPSGQARLGELPVETAKRELLEETGLQLNDGSLVDLGVGNPDSALFLGKNVHGWWLRLPPDFVDVGKMCIKSDLEANPESKLAENIRKSVLVPVEDFDSPSMMTMWAAGLVFKQLWTRYANH